MRRQVAVPFVTAAERDPSYLVHNSSSIWRDGSGRVARDAHSPFGNVPHLAVIDPITKKIDWDQMALDERPGVYVLPIDESGRIGLVRKWRPIPQVEGWELPQGYSRDGERPGDTALRELREEVGDYEIEKVLILRGRSLSKSAFLIHGQPVVLIYVGEKLSDPPEDKNEIILDRHFFFLDEIPMLSVDSEIIGADDRGIIARYKDLLDLKKLPC